jgi:hypothetical protein
MNRLRPPLSRSCLQTPRYISSAAAHKENAVSEVADASNSGESEEGGRDGTADDVDSGSVVNDDVNPYALSPKDWHQWRRALESHRLHN